MAITQTMTTACKQNLLKGDVDFDSDTFKIALYTNAADLDASTAVYTTAGEVSGTGYVAGGNTLSGAAVATSGTVAYVDFADSEWASSTITARGALIYKSGGSNPSIAVLDFGGDKSSSNSTFKITFPGAGTSAIIRIE